MIAPFSDQAFGHGLLDGTVWLRGVQAVVEAALSQPGFKFDETAGEILLVELPDTIFPDTR